MATVKNINSDYTITVKSGAGNVIIDGNLDVYGNITYVSDLKVNDAFIIVAGNNTGNINDGGLMMQTGNTSYAGLRYDIPTGKWQVSSNVSISGAGTYTDLATGNASVSGSNTQVQFNNSGSFGASANLTFDTSINALTLSGHEVLGNIGSTPSAVANSVAIYNKAEGAGGTGLYVKSTTADDELVSLTRARLYAIIF